VLFLAFYCLTWECTNVWKKYWQEKNGSENWSGTFRLLGFQVLLHCNFVLYEVRRSAGSSSHVHVWNVFWSGISSFGDMNNVPKHLAKFPLGLIIIWRIWNECIMFVLDYFMGRKIKHYWLMMNLPKCFKILNGLVFFLNHLGDKCCQITRCIGWTSHHVCDHHCLNCL
jgi:hypothetical protein